MNNRFLSHNLHSLFSNLIKQPPRLHFVHFFFQVQLGLLGLLIVSQLDFIIGSFIIAEDEKPLGVVGYNGKLLAS